MRRFVLLPLVCAVALLACKKSQAPAVADKPAAAPATPPAPSGATKKESDDACVGSFGQTAKSKIEIKGQTYERDGYKLTRTSSDPDDQVVIGVLSDIKEETEENLRNIKAALDFFAAENVELITYLGDSSESEAGVAKVLGAVAAAGLPVFAIVGNRECKAHWAAGVAAAQKNAPNLFDFTQIRLFNSDDVSIISLPGYYNPTYLHCAEGCRYFPSDVDGLERLLKEATGTPMLISHGPPRMEGAQGLDWIHDGDNVGDPALAAFLQKHPIPFGAFANIGEAGGRATDASGKNVVAQDTMAATLYVNPGFMDAVAWEMLDKTRSEGMAAVMTIKGRQASYKIKRFGAAQPAK